MSEVPVPRENAEESLLLLNTLQRDKKTLYAEIRPFKLCLLWRTWIYSTFAALCFDLDLVVWTISFVLANQDYI